MIHILESIHKHIGATDYWQISACTLYLNNSQNPKFRENIDCCCVKNNKLEL